MRDWVAVKLVMSEQSGFREKREMMCLAGLESAQKPDFFVSCFFFIPAVGLCNYRAA